MPTVYETNLAAVRRWLPRVAERIAAEPIPRGWSRVTGADASPTFCRALDEPTKRVEWLGATALPQAAAASMTADMDAGTTSALGLGIGSGHEWLALLSKMSPHQALFVYEPDLGKVRMVLDVTDLSSMLGTGRLVLLAGAGAEAELSVFFAEHIGFDVPTVLHVLPALSPDARAALRAAGEAMIHRVVAERTRRGTEILERLASYVPAPTASIVAFPATSQWPGQRLLASALRASKRDVVALPADRHATASLIGRLEAVARHRPAVVEADFFRGQLGGGLPAQVAVHTWVPPLAPHTYFAPDRVAGWGVAPEDRVIVHSAEHRAAVAAAGVNEAQIQIIPPALAPDEIGEPTVGPRTRVALVGELWPIDPLSFGFELPSHQSVWDAARHLIAEDTRENLGAYTHRAGDLLRRAQRRAGVTLEETRILEAMERAFRHALIRSIAMITLAHQLVDAGLPVKLIGRGWEAAELGARATLCPFGSAGEMFSDVAIFVYADPAGVIDPLMLIAMTTGVAVGAPEHPAGGPEGGAGVFAGGTEYAPCGAKQLSFTLKSLVQDSARRDRMAAAGRAAVLGRHLWEHRTIPWDDGSLPL